MSSGLLVSIGTATTLPGKGPAGSECYVTLKVEGTKAATGPNKLECQDGDPTCDQDGDCHNNSCTFSIQACPNQPGIAGCTPSSLTKLKAHAKSQQLTAELTGSACGALIDVAVAVKGKKHTKPGKTKVVLMAKASSGKPKVDKDKDVLVCTPRPATDSCPTTTSTSTSTTIPTVCGNGTVEGTEQCDPPCGAGCGAGELCDSTCHCVTQAACACGATAPDRLTFTTTTGSGNCGTAKDGGGNTLLDLACGGLYFGGGQDAVPLPARSPDMGVSVTKACCSGTTLTLIGAAAGEVGATARTCTTAGCVFGPPLPIPDLLPSATALSTCVINRVGSAAVGSAQCDTGESAVNLPLSSEIYLIGDIDVEPANGIQPCPICSQTCSGGGRDGGFCRNAAECPGGGTCGGSLTCHYGVDAGEDPHEGMPCTPGDSDLPTACTAGDNPDSLGRPCTTDVDCLGGGSVCNHPYPTSHDCPPLARKFIGALPIGFALTTGTTTRTAANLGPESGQTRLFCGFCRDIDETFCFEGQPTSDGCPPSAGLHSCTSNDQCAQPYEACSQRNNGCFGKGTCVTIEETGSPSGSLADNQPHASTLVSLFCIPPTFNGPVDSAADLPGPGAVSLPGMAQAE